MIAIRVTGALLVALTVPACSESSSDQSGVCIVTSSEAVTATNAASLAPFGESFLQHAKYTHSGQLDTGAPFTVRSLPDESSARYVVRIQSSSTSGKDGQGFWCPSTFEVETTVEFNVNGGETDFRAPGKIVATSAQDARLRSATVLVDKAMPPIFANTPPFNGRIGIDDTLRASLESATVDIDVRIPQDRGDFFLTRVTTRPRTNSTVKLGSW